ncbi:MAG: mycofactocin radical SAM maturase [Syntrophomonas sp.]
MEKEKIKNLSMVVPVNLTCPVNLTWEITGKCNLACSHCLSSGTMASCKNELDTNSCKSFIDELSDLKVFQVNIGGGEPFLRKDFIDILNHCHKKGIVTLISTNGTMINDNLAKILTQMKLTYIQISLDGATAESNDKIRGAGSFEKAIKGIEALNQYGFKNLSINTVVTRVNYREIPELYRLGKYYKAKTRLSRFKPSGRGKDNWDKYYLTSAQIEELSNYLTECVADMEGDSFFSISAEQRKNLALNLCGAAKMTCSLSPDGNVYPCAVLQEDRFCAGNILERPFGEIWRNSPVFKTIRNLEINSCGKCTSFNLCHAGCIAIGMFLRDHLGQESSCINNVFKD